MVDCHKLAVNENCQNVAKKGYLNAELKGIQLNRFAF